MRRRRTSSRKSAKTKQTIEAKRGVTSKAVHTRHLSASRNGKEVARFARERDDAVELLSATSEVLKVISSSRGDLSRCSKLVYLILPAVLIPVRPRRLIADPGAIRAERGRCGFLHRAQHNSETSGQHDQSHDGGHETAHEELSSPAKRYYTEPVRRRGVRKASVPRQANCRGRSFVPCRKPLGLCIDSVQILEHEQQRLNGLSRTSKRLMPSTARWRCCAGSSIRNESSRSSASSSHVISPFS